MLSLSTPKIVRCQAEELFQLRSGVMYLEWNGPKPENQGALWELPEGVAIRGPAPVRFAITLERIGPDSYSLHLVWNQAHLSWKSLTRDALEASCLGSLLAALGTDFQYLLDQPILHSELVS